MKVDKSNLISVCIIWDCAEENYNRIIDQLSHKLSKRYEYFEIIITCTKEIIDTLPNSNLQSNYARIVSFNEKAEYYKMRSSAAIEAIGDVVIITSFDEIKTFDIIEMLKIAIKNNKIVSGRYNKISFLESLIAWPITHLSRMAGFNFDVKDSRTIVFPRIFLNKALKSLDLELALRFVPTSIGTEIFYYNANKNVQKKYINLQSRLSILYTLILNLSPIILKMVSILSGLLVPIIFFYIGYVIIVWSTFENVQEGWATLSILVAGSVLFIALSILGISIGLQYILIQIKKNAFDYEAYDVDSLDIFKGNQKKLNIEVETKD